MICVKCSLLNREEDAAPRRGEGGGYPEYVEYQNEQENNIHVGVGLRGNVGDARYFLRLCGCAIAKDARSVNSYALPRRMGGLQVGYVHLMLVGPP